jgi:hypothetical protein
MQCEKGTAELFVSVCEEWITAHSTKECIMQQFRIKTVCQSHRTASICRDAGIVTVSKTIRSSSGQPDPCREFAILHPGSSVR